ncbi:MAG: RIP metalloprotease RseP [Leptolyngbyaceae bacterium]|nr:RIP metalloprotease RseP [Leptolyngbyaceae bacterium]
MSVLAAISVLALLIVVHELGHFMAARLQGIHVNRFAIGFGPVIWGYQGKQTEYSIRAIPLGGFVGFPDDDPDSEFHPDDPDLLQNRPLLDRAIVISAGVIANLIFAYFVFVAQFAGVGVPEGINAQPGVLVPDVVSQEAPAAKAGIRPGDVIVAIDGRDIGSGEEAIKILMNTIQNSSGQPLDVSIERGNRDIDVTVKPEVDPDGTARIGVQLVANGTVEYRRPKGIGEVVTLAAREFQDKTKLILQGFISLITNFSEVSGQVAGPVKIVEQGAQFAGSDASRLFPFTAIISINLAIINILPLPALDGGQLVFLLIEGLRGKRLPDGVQEGVMQTGLFLLLGLGVFLIVRDTAQLDVIQNFFQ